MRRVATLLTAFVMVLTISSAPTAGELFTDSFDGVLTDNWIPFGSPLGTVRADQGKPSPCFDNNGDASYGSGAFTIQTFDYADGLIIEADFYVPTNAGGCWTSNRMGLCRDLNYGSTVAPGTAVWFTYQYSGALCWGDPDPKNQGEISCGIITETGTNEEFYIKEFNDYLDAWHRFTIEIAPDRRVCFYVDGDLFYQTTGRLSLDYVNMPLLLDGRSHSTGKAYFDNAVVGTYGEPDCASFLYTEYSPDYSTGTLVTMNPDGPSNDEVYGSIAWSAKWSPDATKIVMCANSPATGKGEIFVMNADGSDVQQLTELTATYGQNSPRFRDNDRIWFTWHGPGTGNSELYEIMVDGSGLRQISSFVPTGKQFTQFDFHGDTLIYGTQNRSWSPTGEIFRAQIYVGGDGKEYVDWGTAVQLTSNGQADHTPDISPDGTRIIFQRAEGASGYGPPSNVFVMNADGSGQTRVTPGTSSNYLFSSPVWSPDGMRIACVESVNGETDIVTMDPDGSNVVWVTNTPDVNEGLSDWHIVPCDDEPVDTSLAIDIMPGECPNELYASPFWQVFEDESPLPLVGKLPGTVESEIGTIPVAVLGSPILDVTQIDVSSIQFMDMTPLDWSIEDVSSLRSISAEECDCNADGGDGYPDLLLYFTKAMFVKTEPGVEVGDVITLTLSGVIGDSTAFEVGDCVTVMGRERLPSAVAGVPETAVLHGNYPNPFNPTTEISFRLPEAAHAKLEIFNITGRRVRTLVDGQLEAGDHSIVWDASEVASGVYLYRLTTGAVVETKKMVMMK